MNKFTPELIERILDEFYQGNVRNIYLSNDDDSFIFEGDETPDWNLEGTLCGYSYHIKKGAFKLCLIFDDFDEVIKINSKGSYVFQHIDNESENEDIYDEEEITICDEWDDDFLADEIDFYETLDDSVKSFFLPNRFIMEYHGISIYAQEKIKSTYSESRLTKKEQDELIEEYNRSGVDDKDNTALDIIFVEQIIRSYSNPFEILAIAAQVDDLHSANIGYAFDGRPICHDYGGCACY